MLSSTPMTPAAFYEAFLSILQVHGFIAVPRGHNVVKILPDANRAPIPAVDLPDHVSSSSDEIVTQVIAGQERERRAAGAGAAAADAAAGQIGGLPRANMLIISDRASNVNRIMRIIQRIDQVGEPTSRWCRCRTPRRPRWCAWSTTLYQGQAQQEPGVRRLKVVADERSNSVLISGEQAQRLRAACPDRAPGHPAEAGGDTQVRYLRYADAEKLAAEAQGADDRHRRRPPAAAPRVPAARRAAHRRRQSKNSRSGPTRPTTRW